MGLILKERLETSKLKNQIVIRPQKPIIKRIYLDMDGVLCDFEKKYTLQ